MVIFAGTLYQWTVCQGVDFSNRLTAAVFPASFLFHPYSLKHFYFIDWFFSLPDSCTSPTPASNHCSHLPAVIQVPGGLSLCHWSAATLMAHHTPNHHQKTSARTALRKCASSPNHITSSLLPLSTTYSHLSILTCIHTLIHPSMTASHASALTLLINQGISQSPVWAAAHFDHLLLPTLSTILI